MTAVKAHRQFDMSKLLTEMARSLLEKPAGRLGDEAIRQLPGSLQEVRFQLLDDNDIRLIDFKASCLLELMIALSYARDSKDGAAIVWITSVMTPFAAAMEIDRAKANRP